MKAKHSMFTYFFTKILFSKLLKILLFFTYTSINNPQNIMRMTKTFLYWKYKVMMSPGAEDMEYLNIGDCVMNCFFFV